MLLAGPYPYDIVPEEGRRKLSVLLRVGIRTWISLQHSSETGSRGSPFTDYEGEARGIADPGAGKLSFLRFPIRDMDICTVETMQRILDAVDSSLGARSPVYIHCWGGHGRTGMAIGCWLVSHGLTPEEALDRIALLRSGDAHLRAWDSPQTAAQRVFIRRWADEVRG